MRQGALYAVQHPGSMAATTMGLPDVDVQNASRFLQVDVIRLPHVRFAHYRAPDHAPRAIALLIQQIDILNLTGLIDRQIFGADRVGELS